MTSTEAETFDPADMAGHAHWTREVVRYADTDRQGHVNNAVFAVFLESGRVSILYDPEAPLAPADASFVIARLELDFLSEMRWPNEVWIGTTVKRLGRSSMTLSQGIFVDGACAATARTVIVLMAEETRKSRPFPEKTRARLAALMPKEAGAIEV